MNREEAIRIAQGLIRDFKCESETMVEFCNVVIKALKQQPCDDAISRQAAIMAMNELHVTDRDVYEMELSKCFDNDRANGKLLSLSPVQPTSGWIPVSERLPEERLGVLVYCPTYDNIYCAYLEKGEWKIFSKQADEKINEVVVAWQPLPEPYKAESEG